MLIYHFFKKGKFAFNVNEDGSFTSEDNGFFEVKGGTIEVEVSNDIYDVSFDLDLENGKRISGSMSHNFDQV